MLDLLLDLGVYGARRFVEYQDLRIEGERSCKAHELTLTYVWKTPSHLRTRPHRVLPCAEF